MDLLSITVTGFKRFKTRSSIQTNGKLVAILGPNEAGKSSFLEAVAHLGHSRPLEPREISRDFDSANTEIIGRFFLDQSDLAAAGLTGPRWMLVTKRKEGKRIFSFDPPVPRRNIAERLRLIDWLRAIISQAEIRAIFEAQDAELAIEIDAFLKDTDFEIETLSPDTIALLDNFRERTSEVLREAKIASASDRLEQWVDVIASEKASTPLQFAFQAMLPRTPEFLYFDESARSLSSDYAISELRSNVPPSLGNLLAVAELSLPDLFAAIDDGDTSRVTTLERRASQTLGKKFRSVWKQSGIDVALRIRGDLLEIQIVNQNNEFTSFSERSDGLRQFVALQAFSTRTLANSPVLLIDEAEQRLHYDAQADLVQMLAKQKVSPKVIYTTHSAGCLPEDLGNGVRMISPTEGDTSKIINRFWGEDSRGFAPLLFGMGASTLAFFPTRRAVMVEGPSDMLLYPTLFREVLGRESLGFQFVPGLSNAERTMSPEALRNEVGLAYLVDGDPGGREIALKLKHKGVNEADIHILRNTAGTAIELEDFIEPEQLLSAANDLLAKHYPNASPIDRGSLTSDRRMTSLENAFLASAKVKLPKVDLAYELLAKVNANPTTSLIDPRRRRTLADLAASIVSRLDRPLPERP